MGLRPSSVTCASRSCGNRVPLHVEDGLLAGPLPLAHPSQEMPGFHRFREEKSLRHVATDGSNQPELIHGLDTFSDCFQTEASSEIETRFENRTQIRIACCTGNERAIDFELVERNSR